MQEHISVACLEWLKSEMTKIGIYMKATPNKVMLGIPKIILIMETADLQGNQEWEIREAALNFPAKVILTCGWGNSSSSPNKGLNCLLYKYLPLDWDQIYSDFFLNETN